MTASFQQRSACNPPCEMTVAACGPKFYTDFFTPPEVNTIGTMEAVPPPVNVKVHVIIPSTTCIKQKIKGKKCK